MILADLNSIFAAKDYSVIHFFSKLNFSAVLFFLSSRNICLKKFIFECYFLIVYCGFMMKYLI